MLCGVSAVHSVASGTGIETSVPRGLRIGALNPKVCTERLNGQCAIEVQQTRAAHGKHALRIRCAEGSDRTWAMIAMNAAPAALKQDHFGSGVMHKYEGVATLNGCFQLTYVDLMNGGKDWHSGGSDILLIAGSCSSGSSTIIRAPQAVTAFWDHSANNVLNPGQAAVRAYCPDGKPTAGIRQLAI